ncbi:MAG: TFIIB-type zinc ribbon-containing protein [Nanoarchaeota archaeon]|nr:TFIIB-type zinc ribbon-containing protein [Nanoarchaeota archaeon]
MHPKKCPDCGESKFFIDKEKGEIICRSCSTVVEDHLVDFGRERFIDNEDFAKFSRTGAPFDPRISNNLITNVGNAKDLRTMSRRTKYKFMRMRQKNNWSSSSIEANLNRALSHLKIIASNLKVTNTIEREAAVIYRAAVIKGFTKARSCEKTVIAALYIACKRFAYPKTLKEFSTVTGLEKKAIGKVYRKLMRNLGIKITPLSAIDFLAKFASELNLSPKVQTQTVEWIEEMQRLELTSGKCPMSIAATALYLSALISDGEKRTQKQVSDVAQITEVTLRNRCKEMIRALKLKRQFRGKISYD